MEPRHSPPDPAARPAQDGYVSRIDPAKEFEVGYWSRKFGVSKPELRAVIAQVGNATAEVRAALARRAQGADAGN
jgi:hypothetical protein